MNEKKEDDNTKEVDVNEMYLDEKQKDFLKHTK